MELNTQAFNETCEVETGIVAQQNVYAACARTWHKKVDRRKAKAPSERQKKVVKARTEEKTYKESGIVAGYPAKNAAQSAY